MKLSDVKNMLDKAGFPVAYYEFGKKVEPPYICYLVPESFNFGADNKVLAKIDNIQIELYTENKNIQAELKLENVLDEACIFYEKSEVYIKEENLFKILYEIDILRSE